MHKLTIIGSGPAGLKVAFESLKRGIKDIILIEKDQFGGVCLNKGCIPTKFFVHFLQAVRSVNYAQSLIGPAMIDFSALVEKRNSIIEGIRRSTRDYLVNKGVKIIEGDAQLVDNHVIMVDGQRFESEYVVLAVGSKPRTLDFLPKDKTYTPEEFISRVTQLPANVLIVGGGPIGIEFASMLRGFGSSVTIVEKEERILSFVDKEIGTRISALLKREGITIRVKSTVQPEEAEAYDAIIVAAGRVPQTSWAGSFEIARTPQGYIQSNKRFQTNHPHIFACGDSLGKDMYAYTAEYEAKTVAQDIAGTPVESGPLVYPVCVFSLPAIAWIGMSEEQALASGKKFQVKKAFLLENTSSAVLADKEGMVKVIIDVQSNTLLGGGIISHYASEIINVLYVAYHEKLPITSLQRLICVHPTMSESIIKVFD